MFLCPYPHSPYQVDIDQTLGRCIGTALTAYPNIETLVLKELNV